jgi:hypothetical protein
MGYLFIASDWAKSKKASELLLEFVSYVIEGQTDKIEVKLAVDYSIVAWNWAVFQKPEQDEQLDSFFSKYSFTDIKIQLIREQVEVKRLEFDEYKFIVEDYEVELLENYSLHLSVVV